MHFREIPLILLQQLCPNPAKTILRPGFDDPAFPGTAAQFVPLGGGRNQHDQVPPLPRTLSLLGVLRRIGEYSEGKNTVSGSIGPRIFWGGSQFAGDCRGGQ